MVRLTTVHKAVIVAGTTQQSTRQGVGIAAVIEQCGAVARLVEGSGAAAAAVVRVAGRVGPHASDIGPVGANACTQDTA